MQDLPGYDVQELLATGRTARVWRAVELATGDVVALKRLLPDADPAGLVREADALARVTSPYVVRLRAVLLDGTVLVLDPAAGGTLAGLLARRGALDPGEVVTVAVPLALGLATAHAAGLVHGDLSLTHVLLTGDGMPLLAGLGAGRPPVTAASDVRALATLAVRLLPGGAAGLAAADAPPRLLAVLASALDPDPSCRPSAADLAHDLQRACSAVPLRADLPPPEPPARQPSRTERPEEPGRATTARRALLAGSAVAVLAAAAGSGWAWGRAGDAPPTATVAPVAPSSPPPVSWDVVLDALDRSRADAFAAGQAALLADVWAPGSPGLAADSAAVAGLRGGSATGLRHRFAGVEVRSLGTDRVALRVVDVLGSHQLRAADGSVVRVVAERAPASYDVVLVRVRGRWLLASVAAA